MIMKNLRVLMRLFLFLKITGATLMFWRFRKKNHLSRKQGLRELLRRLRKKLSRKKNPNQ